MNNELGGVGDQNRR